MVDIDMGGLFGQKKGGQAWQQQSANQQTQKPQQGLFGKHPAAPQENVQELKASLSSVTERLRTLEEHYGNVRRKMQLTDESLLQTHKKLMDEIKTLNADIVDMGRNLADVKEKIKLIIKELQECAKKEDVDVLQKYINMWEPVNFVTRHELQKILEEQKGE